MKNNINEQAERIFEQLCRNARLSKYLDPELRIPRSYIGNGPIRLIVLGQDPTVKNAASRQSIKTVLNLDRRGSVIVYLSGVCQKLGISLQKNVYATNLFKNFFIQPPTQIKEINIFQTFLLYWLPLLLEELAQFPNLPVITLGQPVMQTLVKPGVPDLVREYWGYTTEWKEGKREPLQVIKPVENILGRTIFPFPHQPSIRKEFYRQRMNDYIIFMRKAAFSV
jgi:hypothetical protein